jgi:glucose-6-phosphate isomerase
VSSLTESAAWRALAAHRASAGGLALNELFARDSRRVQRMTLEAGALFLDYSRHLVSDETLALLRALIAQQQLGAWRERLFSGERINTSEDRAVLHTALRDRSGNALLLDGIDVMPDIRATLYKMRSFSEAVRNGSLRGATGQALRDIVCIGIGGSDLGPRLVCEALTKLPQSGPRVHFASNLDRLDLAATLAKLRANETLFIVSSKSFSTEETLANAGAARTWLVDALGPEAVTKHMVAVTAHPEAAQALGIADKYCFRFWDWVGGRFSLWSAVGLPIALAHGRDAFEALLDGGYEMDRHFQTAPWESNMPVIMAALGIWYRNFWTIPSLAVVPYAHALAALPAYLQQLDMESNGKSVDRDGRAVDYATAPLVWGGAATVVQHSFFQWLHQGTDIAAIDLIAAAGSQRELLAHFLAQGEGLMRGKAHAGALRDTASQTPERGELLGALRSFPGNRPSSSIVLNQLDARSLGALIALYEHKVFVQGIVWNINSFDQWGVELGKTLAGEWRTALAAPPADSDPPLLRRLR